MEEITADQFKMMMLTAEGQERYQPLEGFKNLLAGAVEMDRQMNFSRPFQVKFAKAFQEGGFDGALNSLIADQMDNYILSSFAAFQLDLDRSNPLVPYAALNKKHYQGWHGEVSNLRALLFFGFDPNAQTSGDEYTALHSMCNLDWHPYAHPLGAQALLSFGADCNLKNAGGDTPMTLLAGSQNWTKEAHLIFSMMLDHGGNPFIKANDGMTALDVLKENQAGKFASEARQALIDKLELMDGTPMPKPAPKASRI